ncbi:calmodulin-like protein isoform X2 [Acanthaster planci]|nr:calmodulin-like protein isoform X2 [Acanthaster planci]XP_022104103.1 calmodulin-like protein isoform X2 [Acanthaster planci]XP_022104104.1 calmodulin-like protein isoform X2 [Acanthaster planci]
MSIFNSDVPLVVLKSLFMKYDKDGNGSLTMDELKIMAQDNFGMNKTKAEAFIMLVDKDGNQRVTFQEFYDWLKSGDRFSNIDDCSRFHYVSKAMDMFKKFDKDGSGRLERAEVHELLLSIGARREQLDAGLKAIDKGGDGTVSFSEFLDYLNWLPRD